MRYKRRGAAERFMWHKTRTTRDSSMSNKIMLHVPLYSIIILSVTQHRIRYNTATTVVFFFGVFLTSY